MVDLWKKVRDTITDQYYFFKLIEKPGMKFGTDTISVVISFSKAKQGNVERESRAGITFVTAKFFFKICFSFPFLLLTLRDFSLSVCFVIVSAGSSVLCLTFFQRGNAVTRFKCFTIDLLGR